MLFIYWLEDNPKFAERVASIHARMRERDDELITSVFTVGEVLAGAYRLGAAPQAGETRDILLDMISEAVPFTIDVADRYAQIRGSLAVKPADAIHLACAAQASTDLFLTNDSALIGKVVPGIQFIAGIDTNML
jgi:predicted nucleic acid-binding protein